MLSLQEMGRDERLAMKSFASPLLDVAVEALGLRTKR
jgi:hypothetical protein|tara:strand:+ start:26216 stop:26326 length:111 start_codon:yes stop_codon:yes gene_type:complete